MNGTSYMSDRTNCDNGSRAGARSRTGTSARAGALSRTLLTACLVALAAACAGGPPPGSTELDETAPERDLPPTERPRDEALPPAGYGTLRQDEVTVELRSGPLLIKVTPLDEAVIRLTAPDTYERLRALASSRRAEASQGAFQEPELFLVSFFSYDQNVNYTPEDVFIVQQGSQTRPLRILGITNGFGRQQLGQQESQSAVYSFDTELDYDVPLTVRYAMERSDAWASILQRLEEERVKVRSRSGS